ncbi:probable polysaccharide biosynthesis protein [Psychrobacter arcticus 273-4]|uniref:Probable polysaccharide biosynthesis protein n=2 Tax=Psychrobacter arcticus TaxID=334543 RepID=Q4FTZ2_PSYA2|nr:probable polysaccharide biosynthesis protein [Psychrobacter arcticus 273-4]
MRCLTLADALVLKGAECYFICREHEGNLLEVIRKRGHQAHSLPLKDDVGKSIKGNIKLAHADWLGATQQEDAQYCIDLLGLIKPDWLVIDHYAIDISWEKALHPYCKKLMVIDDLGDREHLGDLLLDQNYGSTVEKYKKLVPKDCKILAGTTFALLRPEFALWRDYSLKRRKDNREVKSILITLGGVDPDNYTGKILKYLAKTELDPKIVITVVMGVTAPHLQSVKHQAADMPVKTTVKVNVSNMAELMSNADLAIGAAGATTWERCCLGVPTIQLVIAENQRQIAEYLAVDGVVKLIKDVNELTHLVINVKHWVLPIVIRAQSVADGLGAERVISYMLKGFKYDSRYS